MSTDDADSAVLELLACRVELEARSVIRIDGTLHCLSPTEARLLAYLHANHGRIITRQQLLLEVWGYNAKVVSRTVDTNVYRLRKKIERDHREPDHLHTSLNEGYLYVRTPQTAVEAAQVTVAVVEHSAASRGDREFLAVCLRRDAVLHTSPTSVALRFEAVQPAVAWAREVVAGGANLSVAIHRGELFRGPERFTGRLCWFGDALRVPSVLAQVARPGQVVVTQVVWEQLPASVCVEVGEFLLTDQVTPVCLYQLAESPSIGLPHLEPIPSSNLEPERDLFVGRAAELRAIESALGSAPLVTLTGIGGIGKTRLAVHFGLQRRRAWLCSLTEVRDAAGLCAAMASTLGMALPASASAESAVEAIGRGLCEREGHLLILDDVSRALHLAREAISGWMARASEVRFLVTSREPLGLRGELRIEVAPLADDEATSLFSARTSALGHREEAPETQVRDLVRRLGGLPLAIELAAERTRVLSVEELANRLEHRFDLLVDHRDGRRSLKATLDDSWSALAPDERQALAQVSVFAGGFTPDAAEAVLQVSAVPLDLLATLRDRSLLRRRGDRLCCSENVREYAALAEGGAVDRARERYASWVLEIGEAAAAQLGTSKSATGLSVLGAEEDNLHEVHRLMAHRPELGARAAICLRELMWWRGAPLFAIVTVLEQPIAAGLPADPKLATDLLLFAAHARTSQGQFDHALGHIARARELADEQRAAEILCAEAFHSERSGRPEESRKLYRSAHAIHSERGDRLGREVVNQRLQWLDYIAGEFERVVHDGEQSASRFLEWGRLSDHAIVLDVVGKAQLRLRQLEAARSTFLRALSSHERAGYLRGQGMSKVGLGQAAGLLGDLERAESDQRAALAIFRKIGDPYNIGLVLNDLAETARLRGDLDSAEAGLAAAARVFEPLGTPVDRSVVQLNLGLVRMMRRRWGEAQALIEAGMRLAQRHGDLMSGIAQVAMLACEAEDHLAWRRRLPVVRGALVRAGIGGVQVAEVLELAGERARIALGVAAAREAWELACTEYTRLALDGAASRVRTKLARLEAPARGP